VTTVALQQQPDFLRPIGTKNRDEYILVEFHRVLKNTNMSLLYNLMKRSQQDPSLLEIFPSLGSYAHLSLDNLYNATVLYNYPFELVQNLCRGQLSVDMCVEYAEAYATPYLFDKLHRTRIEVILKHLLEQKFVKQIFIFAPSYNDEMKAYFAQNWGSVGVPSRVLPIMGNLQDCLLTYREITTVFMSNITDLVQVEQFFPELLKQKMFVIMEGYDNFEVDKESGTMTHSYTDMAKRLDKEEIASIGYAYPHCIPKEPQTSTEAKKKGE
jgi:hypothetical protein